MEKVVKTINDLCTKITDGAHNSPVECPEGSNKMYSSKDMTYNSFDDSSVKLISLEDYQKLVNQDCQPQKNDVLIIKDGANYLKYVFKVQETIEAVILSSIAILRPNLKVIDPDYFVYLLRTGSIRNAMSNYVSGAAIPRIVLKDFKRMKLNIVPNLSIQKSIANVLLSFDKLIEANTKRIKVLEQMAENLYKEWFVRFRFPGHETAEFENGIPKDWEIRKCSEIALIKAGGDRPDVFSKEYNEENPIPIYSNGIDNDGLYGYTNTPEITNESITISARGTVGFVCLRRKPYVPIVRLISVEPNLNMVTPVYLYYFFRRDTVMGNGTSQQQITIPMVSKKRVLLPPIKIVQLFSIKVNTFFDQIDCLKKKNHNLFKQRDLLLPRLMSGKLEVK